MDILKHNRSAWNSEVKKGNQWTVPVNEKAIKTAKSGELELLLTPTKFVPKDWLGDLKGKRVLCLASGGGQQGPLFAAAGAEVSVLDLSDEQLNSDWVTAEKYKLELNTIQGNMQDLSMFVNNSVDLIFHPVSNCFIDDIQPVWQECGRVLKNNGRLLSGFCNPVLFNMDYDIAEQQDRIEFRHAVPYSDVDSLTGVQKSFYINNHQPFEFGHTLAQQIQGQIDAGLLIAGLYEDSSGREDTIDRYMNPFIATLAIKASV